MNNSFSTTETIGNTVQKAKNAQFEFEKYNQAQVDEVVTAVAWSICNPVNNKLISDLAVSTTGLGKVDDKILKNKRKTLGLLRDLKNVKTVGVIKEYKEKNNIPVIAGGVFPTFAPEICIKYDLIDLVCVGEGENALIDLCNKIENKKVEIIVLKNDKLCFRNSFDFESETDLLYYVLFCFEQLKLYPEKTPLVLFGDVKKEDRNFNILYDYVRNVSFGNKAEKLTYPTEFSEIKNQEYFALFSQVLCV